ncbi:hypothetical protein ABPG75_012542 [Micractinium tetrahymenae]
MEAPQPDESAPRSATALDDSALGGSGSGGGAGGGGRDTERSSRGWQGAKTVLLATKAASRFRTLRDLLGQEAYISPSRLRLLKSLGAGAFARVQQAELWPAGVEAPASPRAGRPSSDGAGRRVLPTAAAGGADAAGQGSGSKPEIVAVKVLRRELLEDPEQVRLFGKEVSLMMKLRHRHIVRFVGCSWRQDGGSPRRDDSAHVKDKDLFYVQEFCGGGSLGELVRRQMVSPFKRLYSDADALRWSLQIAQALMYLHESMPVVIHRDLKLENIMLTEQALGFAEARLADFGLARLMRPEEQQKLDRLTKLLSRPPREWSSARRASSRSMEVMLDRVVTHRTASSNSGMLSRESSANTFADVSCRELTGRTGSFGYMAPEVLRSQQYDASCDIFSLGMCMYCLFCRNIPSVHILLNGGEDDLELYAAKVADGYRPPLLPGLPQSVIDVIECCWKGDPSLRPSARGVVDMLQRVRDSGDVGVSSADCHLPDHGCTCCKMM